MSFIKNGDAQPILKIVEADEETEEKRRQAMLRQPESKKNPAATGNKIESKTESDNN